MKQLNNFITVMLVMVNIVLLLAISSITFAYSPKKTNEVFSRITKSVEINPQIKTVEYKFANSNLLLTNIQVAKIEQIKQEAEAKRLAEEQARIEREQVLKVTVETNRQVNFSDIDVYTDLSVMNTVNVDEMNEILDYWDYKTGGSPFKGMGQAFIDASKLSGLDPVYILAHAALESGWGKSQIAREKFNYYGISAYDHDPYNCSKYMGNNVYEGIVNGAVWISDNYYDAGQTTLYSMRYNNGVHEYCTSDTWMYNISHIMQTSYNLIQS